MTIQSQLDQVLALIRGMPCRCMSVAQLGERDPGCDKCEATEKLEAIRAAVGGEAVAEAGYNDTMMRLSADPLPVGTKLYASPPATVDVGALRELHFKYNQRSDNFAFNNLLGELATLIGEKA